MTGKKTGTAKKGGKGARSVLRWIYIIGTTLCAAGILFALYQFLFVSDFFLIRSIDVSGNRHITREAIVQRTGIAEGDNMLLISLNGADQALESEPWIQSAKVERVYPDRIRIEVKEREPLLWVADVESDRNWVMDREAFLMPMSHLKDEERNAAASLVRDVTVTGLLPSIEITREAQGPPSLGELLAAWNDKGLFIELRTIRVQERDLVLIPRDRIAEIRVGDKDIGRSLAGLNRLWAVVSRENLRGEYIDLRFKRQGLVAKFDIADETTWKRLRSEL